MENKTDNELIAEFIGARLKLFEGEERILYKVSGLQKYYGIPKYSTSWEWLMPVVEKIEGMDNVSVHIINCYCRIQKHNHIHFESDTAIQQNKITAVYLTVLEFIKWYNNHGK